MSRSSIRSCTIFLAAIFILIAPLAWAFADPDSDTGPSNGEYGTKAKYLFSFARFVDWPQRKFTQPDAPLVIGIVGSDPFGDLLSEAVQGIRINGRPVMVRHVEEVGEWRKCHILFVCRSEAGRMGSILSDVRGDNVLTVGETDKFISKGGMINFVMVGDAVRFQIDDSRVRHADLKISSKVEALAVPLPR